MDVGQGLRLVARPVKAKLVGFLVAGASWALLLACAHTPDPAPAPAATEADCARVAAHLTQLIEVDLASRGHVESATAAAENRRASLKQACLEDPDPYAVRCLSSSRTLAETERCANLDPALEPPLADAGERADAAQCERFADHVVELMRADLEARELDPLVADEERPALVRACLGEGRKAAVECALKATTLSELGEC